MYTLENFDCESLSFCEDEAAIVKLDDSPEIEPTGPISEIPEADPLFNVPAAMRRAERWLLYKLTPHADPTKKPRKLPYYCDGSPRKGRLDTPEDYARLASFDEARAALESGTYAGLGFALGLDAHGRYWQGIDLDGTDTRPELAALVQQLPGYVERSPSGTGWHALGVGRDFKTLGSNASGIEAYAHGRYFTVTGNDGRGDLEDIADFVTGTLAPLHGGGRKDRRPPEGSETFDETIESAPRKGRKDSTCFLDDNFTPLLLPCPEDQTRLDLRSALSSLTADDYHLWIAIGMALKTLDEPGRALWLEWSQTSGKYDPEEAERKWDSFCPERIDYRAVFAEAQRGGWLNPAVRDFQGASSSLDAFDPFATPVEPLLDLAAMVSGAVPSFRGALTFKDKEGDQGRLIESQAATLVAQHLKHNIAWDATAGTWLHWNQTHWEPLMVPTKAEKLIADAVEEGCKPIGYRLAYLTSIKQIIILRHLLTVPEWPTGVVPFENGLLDLETLELRPATPVRALDWCLPWRWDSEADCPTIKAWLLRSVSNNDPETVELLRAWLAALVRGLELQFFLTLIGRGGSGKGTFQRLAFALVGARNVAVTDLARLENNRFETAKLYGKRLAMINEAGKYGGSVDVLKAVTGGDYIPLERKHQQQSGSFQFRGLVLMATNEPIIATDSTSGLERRRITVRFPYSATPEERAEWDAKGGEQAVLHAEIPGLIRWLLDMPVSEIKQRLSSLPTQVVQENLLGMAAGNSVAEWMMEECIPVPHDNDGTQIGDKSSNPDHCFYPHYWRWCSNHGRNHPVSSRKFSDTVMDMAQQLGHIVIKKQHPIKRHYCLFGLRLRHPMEDPYHWLPERKDLEAVSEASESIAEGVEAASRKDRNDESLMFGQILEQTATDQCDINDDELEGLFDAIEVGDVQDA